MQKSLSGCVSNNTIENALHLNIEAIFIFGQEITREYQSYMLDWEAKSSRKKLMASHFSTITVT